MRLQTRVKNINLKLSTRAEKNTTSRHDVIAFGACLVEEAMINGLFINLRQVRKTKKTKQQQQQQCLRQCLHYYFYVNI